MGYSDLLHSAREQPASAVRESLEAWRLVRVLEHQEQPEPESAVPEFSLLELREQAMPGQKREDEAARRVPISDRL